MIGAGTRLPRRRLALTVALLGLLAVLAGASSALAYWGAPGSGSAAGAVATLSAPTISSVTAGGGTAALTWTAVPAPGGGSVSYYVTRDGATVGGNCPTSSAPTSATSCTDSGLARGEHTYTVTAVWRSWTARSASRSVLLSSGAATQLVLEAASSAPVAGSGDALTLTAEDASGNTVTSYAGAKSLTFGGASAIGSYQPTVTSSSGTAVAFGSPTAINFTAGIATVSASSNGLMRLYRAQSASITVSDGSIAGASAQPIAVSPAGASVFAMSTPATQTAGAAFEDAITAKDTYGNTATGYTGTKTIAFTGPANSPSGKAPAYPATVNFTAGVGTPSITLYDAQSTTLTATEGTLTATTPAFTVAPAGASVFALSTPATQTAGTAFNETITAKDTYGNTATGYTGTKTIAFTGPANSPSGKAPAYPATVNFTAGVGTPSITLYDAQSTTLTATEGTLTATTPSFAVQAAGASTFVSSTPAEQTAGTAFNETITAKDTYGNTATGYTGTKTIAFTGPASSPSGKAPAYPATVNFTAGAGTASITLYDAQSTTLTATEGTLTATTPSFTVAPAGASTFALSTPAAPTAGAAFEDAITAKDTYGNTATGYTGTKTIAFTGPANSPSGKAPAYPATVNFTAGAGTASITLYDAQSTTLTATEGTLTATTPAFTVAPAGASVFALSTPATQTAGTAFNETITAKDTYGNTATGYTGTKTIAFTGPANSPSGKAPAYPATVNFTAGAGTPSITLYDAQSTTLTATEGTLTATTPSFAVQPGATGTLAVTGPGTQAESVAFTVGLTASDAYGNAIQGAQPVSFSGPSNAPDGTAPSYPSSVTFSNGSGTASLTLYDAQTTAITVKQGTATGTSASFAVTAGTAKGLTFTNATSKGTAITPTCTGLVTALTCKALAATSGSGRSFKANVSLIDAHQNVTTNTSGAEVLVTLKAATETVTPTSLKILAGASSSTEQFTLALKNGSNANTVTASATVASTAVTSSCEAS